MNKIFAILISMLFLTTIPSVIGNISDSESGDDVQNSGNERVWLRGLFIDGIIFGNPKNTFIITFVIIYNISSNPQREVHRFKWADEIDFFPIIGRMYEIGLGLIRYVFGFYDSGLKVW